MGVPKDQISTAAGEHLNLVSPGGITEQGIRLFLAAQIAEVRDWTYPEIEAEISRGGGKLEIDSQEGIAAISALEGELGQELVGPEDLTRDHFSSLEALSNLVWRRIQSPNTGRKARAPKVESVETHIRDEKYSEVAQQ